MDSRPISLPAVAFTCRPSIVFIVWALVMGWCVAKVRTATEPIGAPGAPLPGVIVDSFTSRLTSLDVTRNIYR
ncbi:hypothetical protein STANM309S_05841 [Streptomyces tanashiensis]